MGFLVDDNQWETITIDGNRKLPNFCPLTSDINRSIVIDYRFHRLIRLGNQTLAMV